MVELACGRIKRIRDRGASGAARARGAASRLAARDASTARGARLRRRDAAAAAARITPAAEAAAQAIDGDDIRRVVAEISADAYGGRLPGTEGELRARAYLAAELARLGFAPAGADGSYEQPIELVGVTAEAPATWRFTRGGDDRRARAQRRISSPRSGVQAATAEVRDAELVFAGYAIQAPEYDWDDFKGVDVRGKVLVVLNNDPDWDPRLFEGTTRLYYGRWMYKYESAARQGAAGVDHHSHDAVRGLSVASRADVVERAAVRAAGGRRAARRDRELGSRRMRRAGCSATRTISTR